MKMIEATPEKWNEIISGKEKPVMMMFYLVSCPHCQKMKPIYEELASRYGDQITFARIDAMAYLDVAKKYGITAAPAFKFFRNGNLLNKENKVFSAEQLNQIASDLAAGKM